MGRTSAGPQAALSISASIVVLMVVASVGGLWVDDLYGASASLGTALRGYDLVALVVVVPVLSAALIWSTRGSQRARLIWLSMLAFCVYDYAFYVFATEFGVFFLVHVALFGLSLLGFVLGLAGLDRTDLARRFAARIPARSIAALLFVAAAVGVFLALYAIWSTATGNGQQPKPLSLLAPGYVVAGVLLWRREVWGYVLAAVLVTSGVVHQLADLSALAFGSGADGSGSLVFDSLELAVSVGFLMASALLLYGLRPKRTEDAGHAAARHRGGFAHPSSS